MIDAEVSIGKLVAGILWALTAALLAAVWVVGLTGHERFVSPLGVTSAVMAMVAMTATVRTYMVRMAALMRATAGLNESRPASVHGIR